MCHFIRLMTSCVIALQQLVNVCHRYSIFVDLNVDTLKSFCTVQKC